MIQFLQDLLIVLSNPTLFPGNPIFPGGPGEGDYLNFRELRDRLNQDIAVINRLLLLMAGFALALGYFSVYLYFFKNNVELNELISNRLSFLRSLFNVVVVDIYGVSIFDIHTFLPMIKAEIFQILDFNSYIENIRIKVLNNEIIDKGNPLEFSIYQLLLTDCKLHSNLDLLSEKNFSILVKEPLVKLLIELKITYSKLAVVTILNS